MTSGRAATPIALVAACLPACGSERVIVLQMPASPAPTASAEAPAAATVAPARAPRPVPSVAVDPPERTPPRVSRCELEPALANMAPGCERLRGVEAIGSGAERAAVSAFDGDTCTIWNAGAFPPQHVTLDLGARTEVSRILLVPEMTPSRAVVTHVVEISDDGTAFENLGRVRLEMRTGELVELPVPGRVAARFVRISTVESPSWVAWRDVAVMRCGGRR